MSFRTTIRIVFVAVLLALMPGVAGAAVVVLKNGDRITGLVVKMQDKKLEIDPEYSSNNMTIDWEDVQSITTIRPMSIKLYGDVEIPDNVGQRIRDRIILNSLEEGGPIRLETCAVSISRNMIITATSRGAAIRRRATRRRRP